MHRPTLLARASRPRARRLARGLAPVLAASAAAVTLPAAPAVADGVPSPTGPVVPAAFAFSGAGWGHGVGMSQYGAQGMAREGAKARTILKHYFTGTKVKGVRDDMNVFVSLRNGVTETSLRTEPLVAGGGAVRLRVGGRTVKGGPADTFRLVAGPGAVTVQKNGATVASGKKAKVRWSGTRFAGKTGPKASVLNVVVPGQSFTTTGHRYRYGRLVVRAADFSGKPGLQVVNVVRLHDEYLYGLGEMPSSWRMAALRAQVVAARSYAYVKRQAPRRASCFCHLDSGVTDQVFSGWVKESSAMGARWRKAVDKTHDSPTHGEVVTYGGVPVQTYYSSSTGGRTQNSEDVWSAAVPYLRSVDDRWSLTEPTNPYRSWGPTRRTQAQVAAAFGLRDVVKVELVDRYVSGAVRTVRATGSDGRTATLTGAQLVSRLGLTSRWVRSAEPSV